MACTRPSAELKKQCGAVLLTLKNLMAEPNPENPLEPDIGTQVRECAAARGPPLTRAQNDDSIKTTGRRLKRRRKSTRKSTRSKTK